MNGASLQAAYLLHYTPWRDTSFIVDLFTLEHGRLAVMARGARAAKPATRALYQPFRPLLVSWMGEGELRTLTGIEESGAALVLDGAALGSAYYLNELLLRLLGKEQPQPTLFAHYALAIAALEGRNTPASLERTLRVFELQLLESAGLLPDLAHCGADDTPIEPERRYRFDPASAIATAIDEPADVPLYGIPKRRDTAIAEPGIRPGGGEAGAARDGGMDADGRIATHGRTLLDLARLDLDDARSREEAKRLMRALIAQQLGGRPLRSRSMFQALVPPASPPAGPPATPPESEPSAPASS